MSSTQLLTLNYLSITQLTTGSRQHFYRLKHPVSERMNFCDFKMDVIKWSINFVARNFCLKSYLWLSNFEIPHMISRQHFYRLEHPVFERLNFCDFKMDVIKWSLNFVSRNFGLKSYLRFQILKSCVRFSRECTPLGLITIYNSSFNSLSFCVSVSSREKEGA